MKEQTVDYDEVKKIAVDLRALVEMVKKGVVKEPRFRSFPTQLTEAEYLERHLAITNRLRALCGDEPLVWKKTKEGGHPVLLTADEPEPETESDHQKIYRKS